MFNFFKELFGELLKSSLKGLIQLVAGFLIGTAAGGVACWYFGIPLIFSLLGGLLVVGIMLALLFETDWW